MLDVERNSDHNRCVVSLVGEGEALLDAVFQMMKVATQLIDLNVQRGEHPRMGATDVVPFVPIGASTMAEAIRLAEKLGARVRKGTLHSGLSLRRGREATGTCRPGQGPRGSIRRTARGHRDRPGADAGLR